MASPTTPTYMGLRGRPLSLAVSTVATTGFLLFGYDQGVMSGIIGSHHFANVFTEVRNNATMQGLVTAIYEIGCLIGAMFILAVGDVLGRRKAMIIGGAIMIIGATIQVTSFPGHAPLAQFIIGRVVTGVGNGINTSTIPTYQAECSKTSNRGLLICIEGGIIAFGTVIAYWIDYGCSYGSEDLSWRFPIAFQTIFGFVVCICMIFLPESPRWLLTHERYEDAERVIAALRGYELGSEETAAERDIILDSIRASGFSGRKSTPVKALLTGGKTQHLRRMLIGSSSQLMQQIGGCNAVIYYFPILFEAQITVGDENMALLMGGVNMIVYAIFATTSWFIIERVGRRKLFLYGSIGQCLSMVITFSCLIPGTTSAAKGAAVGLFTYIASFGATWLPLPWLYPAEINPIKTRAKANATSTCTNWLFNFLIVMVTPVMIANIGWGTYLFFAAVNACFIPIIYFFYPETAKRSLEEIDIIFAKGFVENISYVRAAEELPLLTPEQVEQEALKYGLIDTAARGAAHAAGPAGVVEEKALSEKSEEESGSHEELEN
ncbi:general substrate transporter [Annulohypoxylon maeteangense]|uniref:general substrate transporter n=1 Tax=Annulohypoxylon maeteangense TaxID=1927788 RepID=UPI0020088B73|nr:general substrate transporter [Annulohypoxylon maeteangense]KAI0882058.1 general substrate transporter [Annulohypoxylon maeteangense]